MIELYYLGIMLLSGIFVAKMLSYLRLPDITGYIVAGLLIGPSILRLVPHSAAENMGVITQITLGFIAFILGNEINVVTLKKIGSKAFIIGLFQAFSAGTLVFVSTYFLFQQSLAFSLLISAIAISTAPTTTLLIVRQYKAKGPLVRLLLPIVAIDNALGIIVFGITLAIAGILTASASSPSLMHNILLTIWEIIGSVIIGFIIGIILTWINKKIKSEKDLLVLSVGFVLLGAGLSVPLNLSPLLLCMAMGSTFASITPQRDRMLFQIENFTPPIYIAFYTLAGINLHFSVIGEVGLLGLGYILFRVAGKIGGVWLGARLSHTPRQISKYLKFALVPQAGIAIGLAMMASMAFPEFGAEIRTIILGATVIYELIGPFITKTCLVKAGETPCEIKEAAV